ncbi:MAG TPA: hypothetical protein VNT32_08850 [Thermoleophilaceae bacterium]|nr:hypothetical protein [Thermoleophilaceae bacterium]
MTPAGERERLERLEQAARDARAADERGDGWAANAAWRRYERIRDAGLPAGELVARSLRLARVASRIPRIADTSRLR